MTDTARPRTEYTDAEKLLVFAALHLNQNNVKRTARETGVPEQTIRNWRNDWQEGFNTPDVVSVREVEELPATVARTQVSVQLERELGREVLRLVSEAVDDDSEDLSIAAVEHTLGRKVFKMAIRKLAASSRPTNFDQTGFAV